ncbi:MAG: hypothetical protein ETSY1_24860 [Candidatus Entotheonella factor]|uniref:Uncharacterized protein n=1 Tax=Entotheonella factor TaxID=1429438 RepID=W4LG71_ENTF1|nr:MAG: hypothetical protein ETSY1_24860 [Candidatus Entotheonella factor]
MRFSFDNTTPQAVIQRMIKELKNWLKQLM